MGQARSFGILRCAQDDSKSKSRAYRLNYSRNSRSLRDDNKSGNGGSIGISKNKGVDVGPIRLGVVCRRGIESG